MIQTPFAPSKIYGTKARLRHRTRRRWRRRLLSAVVVFGIGFFVLAHFLPRSSAVPFVPPPMPLAYAYIASPNCDERPPGIGVSCVVLHATVVPTIEETVQHFLNRASKVSAHFVVGKNGRVVQMVPIERRAWHAGVSEWEGVPHVNDYSIGIEMVNLNDGKDPYTEAQIQAVAGIVRFLRSRYPIPDSRIVSHAQVALPAGRKSDPIGFDFDKFRTLTHAGEPSEPPVLSPSPP